MEFCTFPLFISSPCAHPKINIHFREETLVQKLKRKKILEYYCKQYFSPVSPGLRVNTKSYCPCRDSPAWTFCMCSGRIDVVMVCEAEGPPIMSMYYFCWKHSLRDCRGIKILSSLNPKWGQWEISETYPSIHASRSVEGALRCAEAWCTLVPPEAAMPLQRKDHCDTIKYSIWKQSCHPFPRIIQGEKDAAHRV